MIVNDAAIVEIECQKTGCMRTVIAMVNCPKPVITVDGDEELTVNANDDEAG